MRLLLSAGMALCLAASPILVAAEETSPADASGATHHAKDGGYPAEAHQGMKGHAWGSPHDHGPHGLMVMIPRLPEGNEKLQLQMQAEIYQKIGEVLARTAGQVK